MTHAKKRFQLFLHEWFDLAAAAAAQNNTTLSSECRHRIVRSFWLDELEAHIRREVQHARGDRLKTLQELLDVAAEAKRTTHSRAQV
jgi:hypothetical protein